MIFKQETFLHILSLKSQIIESLVLTSLLHALLQHKVAFSEGLGTEIFLKSARIEHTSHVHNVKVHVKALLIRIVVFYISQGRELRYIKKQSSDCSKTQQGVAVGCSTPLPKYFIIFSRCNFFLPLIL